MRPNHFYATASESFPSRRRSQTKKIPATLRMAGIRFIYAESRLRGGNDFRRVQHAADQQQSYDNGQRDAVDGERLVREGGHELQEADDHHIADHERHDGGRDGRTPAREHSRLPAATSLTAETASRMPAPNTAGMAIRKLTRTAASRV